MSTEQPSSALADLGDALARLFVEAVEYATKTAGAEAGAFLSQQFREGRVRAVLGMGVGELVFEVRGRDDIWRAFVTLRADALALH